MTCLSKNEQGLEILTRYLAKALDAAQMSEWDQHIEECGDCRGFREMWARLDEFEAPEVAPGFDARLYAHIAAEEARRTARWRRWFWLPVAPVAAAAVVAVALYTQGPAASDPGKQVSKIEIEQVAQAVDDLDLLTPIGN